MDSDALKALVEKIEAAVKDQKEDVALKLLDELKNAPPPSEGALRTTKAGANIAKLKKKEGVTPAVAKASEAVVDKWKAHVDSIKKRKKPDGDSTGDVKDGGAKKKSKVEDIKGGSSRPVSAAPSATGSSKTSTPAPQQPTASSSQPTAPDQKRKLSTINVSAKSTPRDAKSDKPSGLKPKFTGDGVPSEQEEKIRGKGVVLFYDALAFDSVEVNEVIVQRAIAIEHAIFEQAGKDVNDKYRSKNRELFLNLKEKSNAALRDSIVTGHTLAKELVEMDKDALASETLKAAKAALEKDNMFAAQSAGATEAETDAFKCGKCGERKTRYYQMQTRSADEPMTTFVTCTNCNNRWKFS